MNASECHAILSIVTWNSEKYISQLITSLYNQDFLDFHIIIVDNASRDKTLENIPQKSNITIIKNSSNLGFSKSHNKGIEMAMKFWKDKNLDDRFIFIINPDILLNTDCVRNMLLEMHKNKNIAVMGPKLLRMYEEEVGGLVSQEKSSIIDSLGIDIFKSRKFLEKSAELVDNENKGVEDVFAVSGALMCLRASDIIKIKYDKEYFDEDFFAYKEDIDICWRLRNIGKNIVINKNAVAYHCRHAKGIKKQSLIAIIKNQKDKSKLINFLSIRNNIWLVLKNDFIVNYLTDLPFIFVRELGRVIFILIFDIHNIKLYFSCLFGLPKIFKKRGYLKHTQITPKEIRNWIN